MSTTKRGRTPHNPDKLTAKEIGAKPWRLLNKDEIKIRRDLYREIECWMCGDWSALKWAGSMTGSTYRTKLTRAELARLK